MAEPRVLGRWLVPGGEIQLIEFCDENQTPLLGFHITDESSGFALGLSQAVELMEVVAAWIEHRAAVGEVVDELCQESG